MIFFLYHLRTRNRCPLCGFAAWFVNTSVKKANQSLTIAECFDYHKSDIIYNLTQKKKSVKSVIIRTDCHKSWDRHLNHLTLPKKDRAGDLFLFHFKGLL